MANELAAITTWNFNAECAIPSDVDDLLIDGENIVCAYKTIRDIALFTNKRLIVRDSQGLTGKKIEIYSLPYSSIKMYSTENAGKIDFNSEVELWTLVGHIKINLARSCDVRKLDRLIANAILK